MALTLARSQTGQTEASLVGAARTLLCEGGLAACSMRAVAERSGVTAGAIYKHFRDKEALVQHVVALAFEHFELHLLRSITSLPPGSIERLAALGEAYLTFAEANPGEFKILFNPAVTERKTIADLPGQAGYPVLRQCVVEAIESGTVRDDDPDLMALFLWTRVHGIVMLCLACDVGQAPTVLFQATRRFMAEGLLNRDRQG